jgi:signal transduction histidine kinase
VSRDAALGLAVVILAVCSVVAVVVAADGSSQPAARGLFKIVVVAVPIAAGLYAARSPRNARFGFMLMGAGLVWGLTVLAESSASLPYSVGRVAAWLIFPLLAYLMLAFPTGRLAPGLDRTLFGGITILIALLYIGSALFVSEYPTQTPWTACDADCPANAFLLLNAEPAVMDEVVQPLRELISIVLLVGVTASLASRLRAASPLGRRTNSPVLAMCIAYTVFLIAFLLARRVDPGAVAVDTLGVLWALCIPGIALAFFVGLLRRRLSVAAVLERLSLAVSGRLDRPLLQSALVDTLDDPSLELLAPDPANDRWRDAGGNVRGTPAEAAGDRGVTVLDDDGLPRAALLHDPALSDDVELLEPIGSLVLASMRHERLEQDLERSLSQLARSRQRIARAADVERSRIERDLHDGAQQRLITLRIRLSLAEELMHADAAAGMQAVHALGEEIDVALDELRSIAHGVYPSLLSDRGLVDALQSVAIGSALPAGIDAREVRRYPAEVETAVYFTCLEAIQNANKHAAGATAIRVVLRAMNGALRFEVRDDGAGFDPPVGEFNGGLRNMRDRMDAVGGRLTLDSAPGRGTRILGLVPVS